MSISERITDYWGITEGILLARPVLNYARAKTRTTQDQINDLYRTYAPGEVIPTTEELDALGNDLIERYIAARAIIRLIPIARDHYMQERTSKSTSQAMGGSISATYIDKTDELDRLEESARAEISELERIIPDEIRTPPITIDPLSNAPVASFPANRVVDPVAEFNRRRGWRG